MSGPVSDATRRRIDAMPDEELAAWVAEIRRGESMPSTYAEAKAFEDELERRRLIRQRDAWQIVDGRMSAARREGLLPDPSEAMVVVSHLSDHAVRAVYRGRDPMSSFDVAFDVDRWSCLCPEWRTTGGCPHVGALKYLTDGLIAGQARDDREEGSA
jgi:hypothetical protein